MLYEGYNGALAYGPTASGRPTRSWGARKILGCSAVAHGGVSHIGKDKRRQYLIQMCYFDIFDEEVYDLLGAEKDGSMQKTAGRIVDHPSLGATVLGMTLVPGLSQRMQCNSL